jgi:hypothetical protein
MLPVVLPINSEFMIDGEKYLLNAVLLRNEFFTKLILRRPHGRVNK